MERMNPIPVTASTPRAEEAPSSLGPKVVEGADGQALAGQEGNATQEPAIQDNVEMKPLQLATAETLENVLPKLNRFEAAERGTNDILVHLACSDTPAVLSIWANLGNLPHCLVPALNAFNVLNTATGIASIALDSRETYKCLTSSKSTKMDKIVDVAHLIGGDLVSTAASMVPLIAPVMGPIALTFFAGGQLLGLGLDLAKTIYDAKRKGQQSVG
jgi:hypothetical protein